MALIQSLLGPVFPTIAEHVQSDPEFKASAANVNCTFAIASTESTDDAVIVKIDDGKISLDYGPAGGALFSIQAKDQDWNNFFAEKLVRPYQSFWGMLRVLSREGGVGVGGDQLAFGGTARLWRIFLDKARDTVHGRAVKTALEDPPEEEIAEEDAVTGKYLWIDHSAYGKVKMFYEFAGSGPLTLLFLHTAGSDSRQYHSLMNNKTLQQRCTMYAFDLPAHGRSSLGSRQVPQGYALKENDYLESIRQIISKLKLQQTIVCGASMAGHVCLAAAIQARELDVHGAIPCEGCDHLPFTQPIYEIKGSDSSILDPERVCGMCAPMSPDYYKRQIWWQYSSQGYGVFSGDLQFYFKGWDGRNRVNTIDAAFCPVYMLTAEYDYSCTTEASEATAKKIPGAKFEAMNRLGHFPLTEVSNRPMCCKELSLISIFTESESCIAILTSRFGPHFVTTESWTITRNPRFSPREVHIVATI